MKLLERYEIRKQEDTAKVIDLYKGNLVKMDEPVDILVISALPNNYEAIEGTLIKALTDQGINIEKLAKYKAFDLREKYSCWLSQEIFLENNKFLIYPNELNGSVELSENLTPSQLEDYELQFKRILCFEPLPGINPAHVLEDIFLGLKIFLGPWDNECINTVAMPPVACGNQKLKIKEIFPNLLENAVKYMRRDLMLNYLKIIEINEDKAEKLQFMFQEFKREA